MSVSKAMKCFKPLKITETEKGDILMCVHLIHKNKIMVDEILGATCLYFMRILTIRDIDATNIAGVFACTLQAHLVGKE